MPGLWLLPLLLALLAAGCDEGSGPPAPQVYFCPADGCKDQVVARIDQAQDTVVCAVFTFTHYDIAKALARAAQERGVGVWVVVEAGQLDPGLASFLTSRGVGFRVDTNPQLMHDKFTVVDERVVLTGSFNYTVQADTKNDENLLILEDPDLARHYFQEFQRLWDSAQAP